MNFFFTVTRLLSTIFASLNKSSHICSRLFDNSNSSSETYTHICTYLCIMYIPIIYTQYISVHMCTHCIYMCIINVCTYNVRLSDHFLILCIIKSDTLRSTLFSLKNMFKTYHFLLLKYLTALLEYINNGMLEL